MFSSIWGNPEATAEAHLGGVLPLDAHGEGHGEEEDAANAVEGQVGGVHQAAQPGGVRGSRREVRETMACIY